MASLLDFVWSGARPGMALDLYLNGWHRVGAGEVIAAGERRLVLAGSGRVFGVRFEGNVEIALEGQAPEGRCRVLLNGLRFDAAPYAVRGRALEIDLPAHRLALQAGEGPWSWMAVDGYPGWIGLWPTALRLPAEERIAAPRPRPLPAPDAAGPAEPASHAWRNGAGRDRTPAYAP